MANLLDILAQGERVAMRGARQQIAVAPDKKTRAFLRLQAGHEAFHAFVFDASALWLRGRGKRKNKTTPQLDWFAEQTNDAVRKQDFTESLLCQQVVLEGLGHIVLERIDRELSERGIQWSRLRRLMLEQETHHHVFGIDKFTEALARQPDRLPDLTRKARTLVTTAEELLDELAEPLAIMEVDAGEYMTQMRAEMPAVLQGAMS